jgi:hypothetical protein
VVAEEQALAAVIQKSVDMEDVGIGAATATPRRRGVTVVPVDLGLPLPRESPLALQGLLPLPSLLALDGDLLPLEGLLALQRLLLPQSLEAARLLPLQGLLPLERLLLLHDLLLLAHDLLLALHHLLFLLHDLLAVLDPLLLDPAPLLLDADLLLLPLVLLVLVVLLVLFGLVARRRLRRIHRQDKGRGQKQDRPENLRK